MGQYFNTAWLPILVGEHFDDKRNWYKLEGKAIVITMLINSIVPLLEELSGLIKRRLLILKDKGFRFSSQ